MRIRAHPLALAGLALSVLAGALLLFGGLDALLALARLRPDRTEFERVATWVWLLGALGVPLSAAGYVAAVRARRPGRGPALAGVLLGAACLGTLAVGGPYPFDEKEDPGRRFDLLWRHERYHALVSTFVEKDLEEIWPPDDATFAWDGPPRTHEGRDAVASACRAANVQPRAYRGIRRIRIASMNGDRGRLYAYEKSHGTFLALVTGPEPLDAEEREALQEGFRRFRRR